MKENMKYLTNYYQIRDINIERMKKIMFNNHFAKAHGTVFFGDSITEYCDLDNYYPEIDNKYNYGLCGITSSLLLHFLDEGVIKYQPDRVVLMIGTNDLGNTEMLSPRDIALNVKDMCEIIHYNLPQCHIYVVSPIPCLEEMQGYKAKPGVLRSNDVLKMIFRDYQNIIPYEYVTFINAYQSLCNKKGQPIKEYFVDGIHINHQGYLKYTQCIKNVLLVNR